MGDLIRFPIEFTRWLLDPSVPRGDKLFFSALFGGLVTLLGIVATKIVRAVIARPPAVTGEHDTDDAVPFVARAEREARAIPPPMLRFVKEMYPAARDIEGHPGAENADDLDVVFFEGSLYRCVTFDPKGSFRCADEDVLVDGLPSAVRDAVRAAHASGAEIEVTRIRTPDDEHYETASAVDERELVVRVDPSGRIRERIYRDEETD
jgi:hypothetical protein